MCSSDLDFRLSILPRFKGKVLVTRMGDHFDHIVYQIWQRFDRTPVRYGKWPIWLDVHENIFPDRSQLHKMVVFSQAPGQRIVHEDEPLVDTAIKMEMLRSWKRELLVSIQKCMSSVTDIQYMWDVIDRFDLWFTEFDSRGNKKDQIKFDTITKEESDRWNERNENKSFWWFDDDND